MKYITREFDSKEEIFSDREIMSIKCYICRKNVKRKMRWFSANGKYYYSAGYCDKHGYIKTKVRVRKSENQKMFAVKTLKFISEEEFNALKEKRNKLKR